MWHKKGGLVSGPAVSELLRYDITMQHLLQAHTVGKRHAPEREQVGTLTATH